MIIKALAIAAAFSVQSTYAGGDTSIYGIAKSTPDELVLSLPPSMPLALPILYQMMATYVFAPRNDGE